MKLVPAIAQGLAALPGGFRDTTPKGLSSLGTLPTVPVPEFFPDGPMVNGYPWGVQYSSNAARSLPTIDARDADATYVDNSGRSACGTSPNTGCYRRYKWTVTRGFISPDGFNKSVILINGQFPGPTIEANWGDIVQVEVTNKILTEMPEGLTMHWHGFTQVKTPWFDGVPGVSQCPIAPGSSFTYTFQADQYGTSWYHSHYSAQYMDGLFGPIVVAGPKTAQYDIDLGPVLLNDYFHQPYYEQVQNEYKFPPVFTTIDNNLLNGKGMYNCAAGGNSSSKCASGAGSVAKFDFTTGKTHRLRVINAGGAATQKFSVDNHTLTVIAQDFVPIVPYKTDVVTLAIGQRVDVLVTANGKPQDAVWMRSDLDLVCSNFTASGSTTALAAVYYPKADKKSVPKTTGHTWSSNECVNDPLDKTPPFCRMAADKPSTSQEVTIGVAPNSTGTLVFTMDGSSFITDYNDPTLLDAEQGQTKFPSARNVYNFGSNSSVQIVLINTTPFVHPMHLHGHNFMVLSEGVGMWDGKVVNPSNPTRRDTVLVRPATAAGPSHLVLQWKQDNPGVWPLHCHVTLHVSGGLYLNVLELPDQIKKRGEVPMVMRQTCDNWQKWTKSNVPDQIDSGV